jgi:hypothetical protein
MLKRLGIAAGAMVLLALTSSAEALTVTVHPKPTVGSTVQLKFSAPSLPEGGYYYGVVVLRPYRHFTRVVQPACSTSSEMQRTDYGYPQANGQVALGLAPARSDTGRWCRGGSYEGAIYAVPHAPPCESKYPCYESEPYTPNPCSSLGGHVACGVVAPRTWSYPSPLPQPLATGTTIVDRFPIRFPTRALRTLHFQATVYGVNETLAGVVSSRESLHRAGRRVGRGFSTCTPSAAGVAHCTGKFVLDGGTISFAGTSPDPSRADTLTITRGTGRYLRAEGTVSTEYTARGTRATETITLEG